MTITPIPAGPTCPLDKQLCGNEACVREGMCQRSEEMPKRLKLKLGFRGVMELEIGSGWIADPPPTSDQLREGLKRYMEQMKRAGEEE